MKKTEKSHIMKYFLICFLVGIPAFFLIIYFVSIKPAEDAIAEARLAVEGLPLEFDKNAVDITQEYKANNGGISSFSGYSGFQCIRQLRDEFYLASEGGLIKIVKGTAPLKAEVMNPYNPSGKNRILKNVKSSFLNSEERKYIRRYYESSAGHEKEMNLDSEYYCADAYNISNGLMENRIKALESWNERLILLYEKSGIALLEGKILTNYTIKNSRYNDIVSMSVDKEKLTMITGHADIIEFNGESFKLLKNEVINPKGRIITSICRTNEGILVGTVSSGIFYYNFDKAKVEAPQIFSSNKINSIANFGGKIYISSESGLYQRFAINDYKAMVKDYPICTVIDNKKGTVLSGTYFGEVIQTSLNNVHKSIKISKDAYPVKSLAIINLLQSSRMEESVFAITDSEIIRMKSIGSRSRIVPSRSLRLLSANFITALEMDNYGRIWIGYFEDGIDILDSDLSVIAHLENDDVRVVRHLKFDTERGLMYAATSKGIIVIDSSYKFRKTDTTRGLINNETSHISFVKGGVVYCTAGGVTFDSGGLLRSIYAFHNLSNNHTYCSLEKDGKVYVGTLGGLSIIQQQKVVENLTPLNSPLPNNWVTALLNDEEGNIWVGTYGGGISKMNGDGKWDNLGFPFKNIEINNNAMLLLDKMIIAGTLSDGIIAYDFDSREWRKLSVVLPSRNITAFLRAGKKLFIGTDAGLGVLDISSYK